MFPRADEVLIDRAENRHSPRSGSASTGALGSNLARMELRVALEEWMRVYPEFELVDPEAVTWLSRASTRSADDTGPRRLTRLHTHHATSSPA